MSDFVNRRLDATDTETSRCGALQAAIDWDEFNGHTPDPNSSSSINGRFKHSDEMLTHAIGSGGFIEANHGSKWTGIPGYVLQSDLLKRIGNQLTVRDDTFTIRAYGSSKVNGVIMATAYCEANVQRQIDFVDSANDSTAATPSLTTINQQLGRKFRIISFKWLQEQEI